MIQEIGDKEYHCEYTNQEPDFEKDYLLSYQENRILFYKDSLPRLSEIQPTPAPDSLQFLFTISGISFYLSQTPLEESGDFHYEAIRQLRQFFPQWLAFAGVTGYHLATWYAGNRYCGACAAPLVPKEDERALVCPRCGRIIYPNICVAIIVGIIDGDRLLLSKYSAGVHKNYALIAGYVEIGETLEQAVRREIYEEVGLHVKNIRYYTNQPWGFSQSILVGFFADIDGSPEITLDRRELSEAVWMERENVPTGDGRISMTGRMMEAFRNGEEV